MSGVSYFARKAQTQSLSGVSDPRSSSSSALFGNDDSFWELYNGLGEDYRKQLDPLLQYNYQPGFLDKWGNALGFRSHEDSYREELQMQARLAALSLYGDQFQNNYNSAQEKASRERAAGLNPDLTGTDSEPASGMEQPLNPVGFDFLRPAVGFAELPQMFGLATSGLQSVINFGKIFTEIGLTRKKSAVQEIDSLGKAMDVLRPIASSLDPKGISSKLINRLTPQEMAANPELHTAFSSALKTQFSEYSPEARKYLDRAWNVLKNDPAVWDQWYKNITSASESRSKAIVAESIHGAYNLGTEVVKISNKINLDHMMKAARENLKFISMRAEADRIGVENEADYEAFKQKYNIPENVAKSELNGYLASQQKFLYEKSAAIARKKWLDELLNLKEIHPNDPKIAWLIDGLISGQYAPLGSINGRVGGKFLGIGYGESSPINPYSLGSMTANLNEDTATVADPGAVDMVKSYYKNRLP